jgi:hypothetical protein
MKKRQHRATSIEAHESVKEHKEAMYDKIVEGLRKLRVGGHFEAIAEAAGLEPAQVWKRLPEMIELGLVYNVGTTRTTSSGRKAMVRQLVEIKILQQNNIQIKPMPILKQPDLF